MSCLVKKFLNFGINMKIVIFGSREFTDYEYASKFISTFEKSDIEIISGCARGADNIGKLYAEQYGIKLYQFPANWKKYGKAAGYVRNNEMADFCDVGLCFWDGKSRGTKHMIETLKKRNKPCYIILYNENKIIKTLDKSEEIV